MDATIKIGGSLTEKPDKLRTLCKALSELTKLYRICVIPGGGKFADVVRELDEIFHLHNTNAHNMAILGMDQYGIFLSSITPNSRITKTLNGLQKYSEVGLVSFLLPSSIMIKDDPLPHTWDVTSDSISAYFARRLSSKKLVLVTNVDGIHSSDPNNDSSVELISEISITELLEMNARTSVDKYLPNVLLTTNLECFVVNGYYPDRIKSILNNKSTRCTKIIK
jgi:aspartokinase-like uncharacterized kinase